MKHDIDVELIAQTLRNRGHVVNNIIPVPDNAGEYEFEVDGTILTLAETRDLLEADRAGDAGRVRKVAVVQEEILLVPEGAIVVEEVAVIEPKQNW